MFRGTECQGQDVRSWKFAEKKRRAQDHPHSAGDSQVRICECDWKGLIHFCIIDIVYSFYVGKICVSLLTLLSHAAVVGNSPDQSRSAYSLVAQHR